jgi:hypothetical protein
MQHAFLLNRNRKEDIAYHAVKHFLMLQLFMSSVTIFAYNPGIPVLLSVIVRFVQPNMNRYSEVG